MAQAALRSDRPIDLEYELEHRYTRDRGRVFLTGIQALVRLLVTQRRLDRAAGLRTAGFVSGYRGSPLAGLDLELWRARDLLAAHDIRFQPGINEALAATAVYGSQQVEAEPNRTVEGVFALWYGKGPGVDWAGDAIKHGHAYGSSPHGGVLVVAGDDHGAVSSTMAHQSDQALAAWYLPVLNPSNLADYLELGLYGWALSRFSGAWVGFKAISETVESAASLDLPRLLPHFRQPADFVAPRGGLHFRWVDPPSVAIEERLEHKLEAARAFARANPVDRLVVTCRDAWLGIVTVGKAHGDLMEAFAALGFEGERAIAGLGIRMLQVRQAFPLEPVAMQGFAKGLERLLVVEEKRPFVELQLKDLLYGLTADARPAILGKRDLEGGPLLPATGELRPHRLGPVLADLLRARCPQLDFTSRLARPGVAREPGEPRRTPFFCSGCPHNTSTRVPEGSKAMGGIGCHIMATWMPDRPTLGTTQMGGEGANWTGLAPFTTTEHVFQNLGDGTFFHSGHLAIRQAVAAGTRMTYKILFNDAVAMTGGQPHDGKLDVAGITRLVWDEGVRRIAVASDEPEKYQGRANELAPGTTVHARRDLDALQRELREFEGVSVLVYDQTCAAEKRRRRKKGAYPDPDRRIFINERVCEACGDCSRASNCLSVVPVETELGTKRQIDQSSCNKDFSCVEGFCPSFVSVSGVTPRRGRRLDLGAPELAPLVAALPQPAAAGPGGRGWQLVVTGVGGTGVLTVGALIGMAAHLEGRTTTVLDFTGLAQKGGAVLSHVRFAPAGGTIHSSRIEPGEADALIACDLVVGGGSEARNLLRPGQAQVVANADILPTADLLRDPSWRLDRERLVRGLRERAGEDRVRLLDAAKLAADVIGDTIGANVLLLGFAWQSGLVPVSLAAMMRAIELNGVAVVVNREAFTWGRLAAHVPAEVARLTGFRSDGASPPAPTLAELVERHRRFLTAYQDAAWARRYAECVERVARTERAVVPHGRDELATAVASSLFKLMSYKDEYEVARLFTDGGFEEALAAAFEGKPRVAFHMAPPLLARPGPNGERPRKVTLGPWLKPVLRLLRHSKRLRGTAFDPFGRTHERRSERALIQEFETVVEEIVAGLRPDNHDLAVKIARLPQTIRGFGHVKAASIEGYRAAAGPLRHAFLAPAALPIAAE